VHGLGSTYQQTWVSAGWPDVLEAEGHTVRAVALPGHVGAGPESSGAEAVLAAARREGKPVAAVGFSAGAIAVLLAAVCEPARFQRIALLGIGDGVLASTRADVGALVSTLRNDAEPPQVEARTLWRLVEHSGNDRHRVADFLASAPTTVAAEALSAVSLPVLVVVGERDAALPADSLVATLPRARLLTLAGVDHFGTPSALRCLDAVTHFLAT
jgi:pimeloyl-ACP methyl ester carboxylesterase